ncbi:MAG TPA: 3-methyladenine DNA glycosylase [Bacteroidales bacterium]|nr:3-methyladenine DNA glycosylase [Bacteroidales bacterium]
MEIAERLTVDFFTRDVLEVAPELIGKNIVIRQNGGRLRKFMITETEAYRGLEDKACHASRGVTPRNKVMFERGGKIYVYFIYGMYWMLNFVAGEEGMPQAALIRGIEGFNGPGKLTEALGIDKSYYGEDLTLSDRIWIEDTGCKPLFRVGQRIGVDYAGEYWKNRQWRYYI